MSRFILWAHVALFLAVFSARPSVADEQLERSMLALGPETIAAQAHFRGDARRGALLFFKSAAGCVKCHGSGPNQTPLGPDLTTITKETTDAQIVESILQPSKVIRKGFETVSVVTNDGKIITGLVARKNDNELVLRDAANLEREIVIAAGDIEEQKVSEQSMMPQQLVASLYSERDMYDLVRYVVEVARGGKSRAAELRPSPQQLVVIDDTEDLNHAGILRSLGERDYKAGQRIFFGHCQNCHGRDGNTPTLPTARAFGRQPLKYGADPLSMLKTLTRGAGLMSPMQHLTPRERYQVIHFIREEFMKPNNPVYEPLTDAYLAGLPKGSSDGEGSESGERDYGPVLGSQLGNQINNVLTFRLPENLTISYDLHQMRVASAWEGGFLNLSQTQHYRQRGERMPQIDGELLPGLGVWQWAYGGSFDIPADAKPPRGPLPSEFMQYHGHYLYGKQAILSYSIEGRKVLETVAAKRVEQVPVFTHTLRIEPSDQPLRLAVAGLIASGGPDGLYSVKGDQSAGKSGDVAGHMAMISGTSQGKRDEPRMANRAWETVKGEKAKKLDLGTPDRTTLVRFRTKESGTLIASTPERGEWKPNGKSLFVRGGRLVFDIGWVGAMTSRSVVNDGEWHTAAIVVTEKTTQMFVDGKLEAEREAFRRPAEPGFVLKVGATSTNFGGDYSGDVEGIRIVDRAITNDELAKLKQLPGAEAEGVLFSWTPSNETPKPAAETSDLVLAGAAVNGNVDGLTWEIDDANRIVLNIPAGKEPRVLSVTRSAALGVSPATIAKTLAAAKANPVDLATRTSGGPVRWSDTLEVGGQLGESINGYALDSIRVPFENSWNAWIRTSALDFFPDGRAVVTTHGGDVYIVSGLDSDLSHVTWRRFVAGLFEPFGVRVIDGTIYVTCRDGLKRLHDYDNNGEADFIEAFWNDDDVSCMFHAYNFDLQTDSNGNFYFAKAGQYTQHHRPGSIMRIPPEGGYAEVVAWGLRTPNGMGKLFDDRFTVSDNQGPWMPAGKISLIEPGGFYGNMPINDEQKAWLTERSGGQLPKTFDEPIIWMPQELDNSCGGQIWVSDERFGPLSGRLIHSSYGKGWLYYLSLQEVGGKTQASIVALPHQWDAGVMRLRTNPHDGQLYGTGLSGWQGPRDGKDGCLQRLRYTGEPVRIIENAKVVKDGLELEFSFDLDPQTVTNPEHWQGQMWDYLWSRNYGSDQYSVLEPGERKRDTLTVAKVELLSKRKVHLVLPDLKVCDQVFLKMDLQGTDGFRFLEEIYLTVHGVPEE